MQDVHKIIGELAKAWGISSTAWATEKNRGRKNVALRKACFWFLHTYAHLSYTDIGRELGIDHSTVRHHARQFADALRAGEAWATELESGCHQVLVHDQHHDAIKAELDLAPPEHRPAILKALARLGCISKTTAKTLEQAYAE